MRVIPPITITPAMITNNILEPSAGEIVWSSGTYNPGDRRILTSTHKIYEMVGTAGSVCTIAPNLDTTKWLEVGPTNKYAMIDIFRNTSSVFTEPLNLSITPTSRIDSIAIMGANIYDISIQILITPSIIYTYSSEMTTRTITDYYEYFFQAFEYKKSLLRLDIPPVTGATILITTSQPGSIAAVVIGNQEYIGKTQRGHTNDANNFSVVTRDAYGNSKLVQRRSIPKTSQNLVVDKADVSNIIKVRDSLKASPAIWSGLDDSSEGYFDALLILGIYKNFSLSLDYPEYATCSIDLEEI